MDPGFRRDDGVVGDAAVGVAQPGHASRWASITPSRAMDPGFRRDDGVVGDAAVFIPHCPASNRRLMGRSPRWLVCIPSLFNLCTNLSIRKVISTK